MTRTTSSLRVVESAEAAAKSPELHGLRKLSDGSIEYQVAVKKGEHSWRFLCSPITVVALTRNADSQNWGRLLEIADADGHRHRWMMPASMLASIRGEEIRQALFSYGARISPGQSAAAALHRYLMAETDFNGKMLPKAREALRTGWHDGVFVLPMVALGGSEEVAYQNPSAIRAAIRKRGTLKEWQSSVADPADANTRLTLALCASFAAPLLQPLQMEGVCIHFRGGSSVGKTTALHVAGSVWGGPCERGGLNGYKQTWRATANGFEGLAQAHCDLPLCLDELGLIRGDHVSQVAYQLTGGMGATRALKAGSAAPRLEWRVLIISTGEIGLGDKIAEQNTQRRIMAGQEVRFIDVPADAGRGYGLFDWAPELASSSERDRGRAFADRLNDASQSFFGNAGPAFVDAFITNRSRSLDKLRAAIFEFGRTHSSGTDGQVQRVARVFGLLGAAGELAVEYGIVPWPQGNALQAAKRCFEAWLSQRGGAGASELQAAIAHLRLVIERDVNSRFQQIGSGDPIRERLGFQRARQDGEIEYLILPESWKQLMAGRDAGSIANKLGEIGILKRDSEGRPIQRSASPAPKIQYEFTWQVIRRYSTMEIAMRSCSWLRRLFPSAVLPGILAAYESCNQNNNVPAVPGVPAKIDQGYPSWPRLSEMCGDHTCPITLTHQR